MQVVVIVHGSYYDTQGAIFDILHQVTDFHLPTPIVPARVPSDYFSPSETNKRKPSYATLTPDLVSLDLDTHNHKP